MNWYMIFTRDQYESGCSILTDVDECIDLPDVVCKKSHEKCQNTIGSFMCQCQEGFSKNNGSCEGKTIGTKNRNIIIRG